MDKMEERKKILEIHSTLNTILETIKIFKENTSGDFSHINCELDILKDIEYNYKAMQDNQNKNTNEVKLLNSKINNLENRIIENNVKDDINNLADTMSYYYQCIANSDTSVTIEKNHFDKDEDKLSYVLNSLDDSNKKQVIKYAEFLLSQQY